MKDRMKEIFQNAAQRDKEIGYMKETLSSMKDRRKFTHIYLVSYKKKKAERISIIRRGKSSELSRTNERNESTATE